MIEFIQDILIYFLAIGPVGFIGAIAGLLGGGSSKSKPDMKGYSASAPKTSYQAPEPQEAAQQTEPEKQTAKPVENPRQETMVADAPETLEQKTPELQQRAPALSNLVDTPKPRSEPGPVSQAGEIAEVPDMVNRSDEKSPVAPITGEQFGEVPKTLLGGLLPNRLFDAGTNKQPHQWQEGMPAKHFETDSEKEPPMGLQYKQTSTVAGSVPARKYRA
jgi:hypothetical protein